MKSVIVNLIYGIESGKGLPEKSHCKKREEAINLVMDKFNEGRLSGQDESTVLEEAFTIVN